MTSRLTNGPSDNAYHVGDCIERLIQNGWDLCILCAPREGVSVTAYKGGDHTTAAIERGDLVKNLRLALETVIRRVRL